MECNEDYFVNDRPRLDAVFTNPGSVPTPDALEDPSALVMRVVNSDGSTSSYTYSALSGPIKRASLGTYYCETVALTVTGRTVIWWEAELVSGGRSSQKVELLVKRK
jgi:hypothetical protein